jgi:hypothetical protein
LYVSFNDISFGLHMSDSSARRPHDTVIISAALVMPDETPPYMGFDTARVPVRVVWHTPDPLPPTATGGGPAASLRGPAASARMAAYPVGDDPPPDVAAAPASEQAPSGDGPRGDPVARFLKVNEALDRTAGAAAPETPAGAVGGTSGTDVPDPTAPVPVVDDSGVPIQGARGPMLRPASLPPQLFVNAGIHDKKIIESLINSGEDVAAAAYQLGRLLQFRQGGPWDAQRLGNTFHDQFVDYSTVAIGLYAAAAGIPENKILSIENAYAGSKSEFGSDAVHDKKYPNLAERNVKNTYIGYAAYQANRVRIGDTE